MKTSTNKIQAWNGAKYVKTYELRTTLNRKAPGRDQIANFCLKQLTATHKHIAALFNKLVEEDQIREW